jgi:hypothetical protein
MKIRHINLVVKQVFSIQKQNEREMTHIYENICNTVKDAKCDHITLG